MSIKVFWTVIILSFVTGACKKAEVTRPASAPVVAATEVRDTVKAEAPAGQTAVPKEGDRLYVWAAQTLDLRQLPSQSGPLVKKIPYGTQVTVIKQDEKSTPVELNFFQQADDQPAMLRDEHPQQIMLNGQWIKIKTDKQEGYALNHLLLDLSPKNSDESYENYLVRVFELTNHQQQKKQLQNRESGTQYKMVSNIWTSPKNGVILNTEETDGDESTAGSNGKIIIPQFTFDQGLVFFNYLMPVISHGYKYQPGQLLNYLIDESGNAGTLKKIDKGISYEWEFAMP